MVEEATKTFRLNSSGSECLSAEAMGLLRFVDRAELDHLVQTFATAVGLPALVLATDGRPFTTIRAVCPVCTSLTEEGNENCWSFSPESEAALLHCRFGLTGALTPVRTRVGKPIAAVLVGPLTLADANLGEDHSILLKHGTHPKTAQSILASVPRAPRSRVETASKMLADVLETVIHEAAVANENLALLATQRQANNELSVLYAVAQALNSGLDLDAILQLLADTVGQTLDVEVVNVWLIEDGQLVPKASRGYLTTEARTRPLRVGEGFAGRVASTGELLTCSDMQGDARLYLTATITREGLHAFAGIPIKIRSITVGVLTLYRRTPYHFLESKLSLLSHIAALAAAAIERARLYEGEQETVATLRKLNATVECQHQMLKRATAIHDELTQMVLESCGLKAIVETLSRLLGNPVTVENRFLHLLAHASKNGQVDAHLETIIQTGGTPREQLENPDLQRVFDLLQQERHPVSVPPIPAIGMELPRVVAPIIAGGDLIGYLSVLECRRLQELDFMAVEHAATIVALELVKQRTAAETEYRLRCDLLDDLISDSLIDPEKVRRQAAHLGYDLQSPYAVLVFEADAPAEEPHGQLERSNETTMKRPLVNILDSALAKRGRSSMTTTRGDSIIVAAPLSKGTMSEGRKLAEYLQRESLLSVDNLSLSVGIGRVCKSPRDFALAFKEAHRALLVVRSLGGRCRTVAMEDLGVYRLLVDLGYPSATLSFADQFLGSLERYDHKHSTQFIQTLNTYLIHNGSLQHTATALDIHVNTLNYRLQRIRAITGLDYNDSDTRLNLQLAIRIRHVTQLVRG